MNRKFRDNYRHLAMAMSFLLGTATALAQAAPSDNAPAPFPAAPPAESQAAGSNAQPAAGHHPRVFNSTDAAPVTRSASGTTPPVQIVTATAPTAAATNVSQKRKSSYEVKVGATDWIDTGIPLNAGDTLKESATGTLTFADGHTAEPDGARAGWRDLLRQYPLPTAPVGALIGRIGSSDASVPFLLGANGSTTSTTSGNLFLRANVSNGLSADGEYKVKITFPKTEKSSTAATAGGAATAVDRTFRTEMTPTLFANIPRRVQDEQGDPGDMVNFALIGTDDQVAHSFASAGWVKVDKTVGDAILHGIQATMEHQAYLEMPMSTLFLFGRPQDLSYARAAPLEVAAIRHHVRVWDSGQKINGRTLWVGSATHDNGFEKDERNGKVTHHIDPNIDEERDFLLASFLQAGATSVAAYVLPTNPVQSAHTATGGSFETDGRVAVMELK